MILSPLASSAISTAPIPSGVVSVDGDIVFNSFSLNDGVNIITSRVDNNDMTGVEINQFSYSGIDGGGLSSRYYRGRDVTLVGSVRAETQEGLFTYIDSLKKALAKKNGILKIEGRQAKATMKEMKFSRDHYHIDWMPINITFSVTDPYWESGATTIGYTGVTGNLSEEISYIGTAPSVATWIIVVSSGTGSVSLTHSGLTLSIGGTLTSGDVLSVNGSTLEVKKNGADVDYTGVFPTFSDYSNPFTLSLGSLVADVTLISPTYYL